MSEKYSKLFFNKEVYDINEADIVNFFKEEREESSILEFKSGNVKLEKIYKEVTALHNSQGGLLIVGSPIPKKDERGRETFHGKLTRSPFRNKDWLYQKLYSNISPAPINVQIHDIHCEDNEIIQVLDIPKSINPPHQDLSNGVYFIRFETETKFAPHGLVEALFNKRKEPLAKINPYFIESNRDLDREIEYVFNTMISNITDIPIIKVNYLISFYNVSGVFKGKKNIKESKRFSNLKLFIDNNSGGFQGTTLVKGIGVQLHYLVNHISEPFIVSIYIWGDNMKLLKVLLIVSPLENKFRLIEGFEEEILFRAEKEVIDIINVKKDNEDKNIRIYEVLLDKIKESDLNFKNV